MVLAVFCDAEKIAANGLPLISEEPGKDERFLLRISWFDHEVVVTRSNYPLTNLPNYSIYSVVYQPHHPSGHPHADHEYAKAIRAVAQHFSGVIAEADPEYH